MPCRETEESKKRFENISVYEKHRDNFLQQSKDLLKADSLPTMIPSTIGGGHDEGDAIRYFYNHKGQRIDFLGNILDMPKPKIQARNEPARASAAAASASPSNFTSSAEADQRSSSPVFRPSNQAEASLILPETKGKLSTKQEASTTPPTNSMNSETQIRSPTVDLVMGNTPADTKAEIERNNPEIMGERKGEQRDARHDGSMDAVRVNTSNSMTIPAVSPPPTQCSFRGAG
jgi:hypothetical protein